MTKNLLSLGGSAVAAFLFVFSFSSCHDEAAENVSELAYRHSYEDNFVKLYGEVNPNQTWDFSSYARRYNLSNANTRADGTYKSIAQSDGYYYVPTSVTSYITSTFPEHRDNASKVSGFMLCADQECTFEIAYAYQGRSEPVFDLYACVWDSNNSLMHRYKVLSKGECQVSNNNTDWSDLGCYPTTAGGDAPGTLDYTYVRSKPYQLTVPANSFTYFFIKITDDSSRDGTAVNDNRNFAWVGDELASIDDPFTVGLVDIATPDNIKAINPNYEAILLAIDDFCLTCQEKGLIRDNQQDFQDFNDVMFLVAGNIPEPGEMSDSIKSVISKRYMIEDLYAYDYDFNDIVVDATQTTMTPYTYTHAYIDASGNTHTGSISINSANARIYQSAKMAHLCGTLPFQITVGTGDPFGKVTDPTNHEQTLKQLNGETTENTLTPAGSAGGDWEPDFEQVITGWVPSENNITAAIMSEKYSYSKSVLWPGEWTGAWTSEFPAKGDVPYIIAVDVDVDWMPEKQAIPDTWVGGDMTAPLSSPSTETTNP